MPERPLPPLSLPALPDQLVSELLDFLRTLTRTLELHYAEQLRHLDEQNQIPLFDDQDLPF